MRKLLISSEDLWDQIHQRFGTKGGVYKLHCFSDPGSQKVRAANRLLGTDENGVLYIGKAVSYIDRVINLKKALSPDMKSNGHICGRRYWNDAYKELRKKFPFKRLCVSFIESDTPDKTEKEEIEAYCRRFGEPPPLNRME